jgi:chromosome segregation ATPase
MNENIKLIESLKEISREEIQTLKTKLQEKEILIDELNKRIEEVKNETSNSENTLKLQEEIKMKDVIITNYKMNLEERNNYFEEQSKFFSKLFYELSVNNLVQRYSLYNDESKENIGFNWKID